MLALVFDVENTVTELAKDKTDYSPYHPNNKLVSVAWELVDAATGKILEQDIACFNHAVKPTFNTDKFQDAIDKADMLVAHNLKHDLQWILAVGFIVPDNKKTMCTMVREYVLDRGQKSPMSLDDVALRRLGESKIKVDWSVSMYDADWDTVVDPYNRRDTSLTTRIFLQQNSDYMKPENKGLIKTMKMSCEFTRVLVEMEEAGLKIDTVALDKVGQQFEQEAEQIKRELHAQVVELMGNQPINLSSPEDMSKVVFGVQVKDKKEWARLFNIGTDDRGKKLRRQRMSNIDFQDAVAKNTIKLTKQNMHRCDTCNGTGKVLLAKKDGSPRAKPSKCKTCEGNGYTLVSTGERAGLGMVPKDIDWASSSGFKTDKHTLNYLMAVCANEGNSVTYKFLENLRRLSAVESYIASFVNGIKLKMLVDVEMLHGSYNQCATATGRLSASDPNTQNFPREKTFPIRKVFISRFKGGKIIEADFAQLEFRCAGVLANCPNIIADVAAKKDIHKQTAKYLTDNGQETDRQTAKSHTFKPLYGGMSGSNAERAYYKGFLSELYPAVGQWHVQLHEQAIKNKLIRIPTGREYAFPNAYRTMYGKASEGTRIVNYPVQGFATADIVPVGILWLRSQMKSLNLKARLVLTVHDSVVIDSPPDEVEQCTALMKRLAEGTMQQLKVMYNIELPLPLEVEVKVGDNLMETKVV